MRVYREIYSLLTPGQRRSFIMLIAVMMIMAVLDVLGVASVLPFLAVVADPSTLEGEGFLASAYDQLGFETRSDFLQVLGLAVFVIVTGSIGFKAVGFYVMTRFNRETIQSLAITLLERYLAQPYEWFLQRNSSEIGKSILSEAAFVVNQAVAPAFRIIAHGLATVMLCVLLLMLEPLGALLAASIIGGAFAVIYLRVRRSLKRLGKARIRQTEARFQITQEAMLGIKEVKLLGLEKAYADRFAMPSRRLAQKQAKIQMIGDLPRYALEAIVFGGMILFVLYLLYTNNGRIETAIPILGTFAFAGLRLMPMTQALFKDVATLSAGAPAVSSLAEDLETLPRAKENEGIERLRLNDSLELRGLSYTYPEAKVPALDGIDLRIDSRQSIGIVGQTGAGKTTLVDVVLGLLKPTEGEIVVDGAVIGATNRRAWQFSIGYVPQTIFLVDDSIAANIAFSNGNREADDARIREAARLACLDEFIEQQPEGFDTMVGERGIKLSGGQRQRIGIARALYNDPDLVVFDEATSALDPLTEKAVMDAISALKGQKTVIVITHRLSTVRNCDRILMMEQGRISEEGSFDELASRPGRFRDLLQVT
ncbi:ABC transporter ATP-binding protein [Parvularcula sp. ZS-1/3]|uniref:ABC transporter ATP-binding protein n=1 Tax=Parvularcula mediterranea TaxID=2732508 RepID=A0A7Y3RNF7_9PROT|nr:ABC transporter ATP-binding protein [Parvularcula mediterranea]NNU16845.1 ABC transporter ATP-binding protein [Parvularcula mediterranea]